jgi:putative phosphotransacetylase
MDEKLIQDIVQNVVTKIQTGKDTSGQTNQTADPMMIPVNASNRHIHLSRKDTDVLFGTDYQFGQFKQLSQPGQYAAKETLIISGPKGTIQKVRILGPCRKSSQVEILAGDQYVLGIKAPVRQSGDLAGSGALTLIGPKGSVYLPECAIIAQRHIHLDPARAQAMKVADKDFVSVEVQSDRPLIFRDVLVRVDKTYAPDMHIDVEEANACLIKGGTLCKVNKQF